MRALNKRFRPSTWRGIGTQALIFGGASLILIILALIVGIKAGRIELSGLFIVAGIAAMVFAIKEQKNLPISRLIQTINQGKRDRVKKPMELRGG